MKAVETPKARRRSVLIIVGLATFVCSVHLGALWIAGGWAAVVSGATVCLCAYAVGDAIRVFRNREELADIRRRSEAETSLMLGLTDRLTCLVGDKAIAGYVARHVGNIPDDCDDDPAVHILFHGRPLCGKPGIPADWEPGNYWVRVDEREKSTCVGCQCAPVPGHESLI